MSCDLTCPSRETPISSVFFDERNLMALTDSINKTLPMAVSPMMVRQYMIYLFNAYPEPKNRCSTKDILHHIHLLNESVKIATRRDALMQSKNGSDWLKRCTGTRELIDRPILDTGYEGTQKSTILLTGITRFC